MEHSKASQEDNLRWVGLVLARQVMGVALFPAERRLAVGQYGLGYFAPSLTY